MASWRLLNDVPDALALFAKATSAGDWVATVGFGCWKGLFLVGNVDLDCPPNGEFVATVFVCPPKPEAVFVCVPPPKGLVFGGGTYWFAVAVLTGGWEILVGMDDLSLYEVTLELGLLFEAPPNELLTPPPEIDELFEAPPNELLDWAAYEPQAAKEERITRACRNRFTFGLLIVSDGLLGSRRRSRRRSDGLGGRSRLRRDCGQLGVDRDDGRGRVVGRRLFRNGRIGYPGEYESYVDQ